MSESQTLFVWLGSRILLSFLSALAGWMVFVSLILAFELVAFFAPKTPQEQPPPFEGILFICVVVGIFVLVTWIFLLVPLALFIPSNLAFWKPGVLTIIGAITGPLIMLGWTLYEQHDSDVHYSFSPALWVYYFYDFLLFVLPAAIIGGVTGYIAALMNKRQISPSRHSTRNG